MKSSADRKARLAWSGVAVVSAVFLVVFTLHATDVPSERMAVFGGLALGLLGPGVVALLLRRRRSPKGGGRTPVRRR